MKNYKLFFCIVAFFSLMSGGCQENKLLLETKENKLLLETTDGSRIPPDTLIWVSLSNTLDQWFTLVIYANGETVYTPTYYNGYNPTNLPPQGVPVKSRISREELEEIVSEFENQNFFSLKNSYKSRSGGCESAGLDAGAMTVSIEIGGRKKSVNWDGCEKDGKDFPPEFFAVFDKINRVRSRNQG